MKHVRILVVEDERITAKEIRYQLIKLECDVLAMVSSGEEAIQNADELRPDLVLMDIKLEGDMDGIEAADHIQSRFGIPVVYITAYTDEETLQRAKRTEPYGYLIKPIKSKELYSTIEMALHKHKMEEKLRENEEKLKILFEFAPDAYYLNDLEGKFIDGNKAAEELTGYTRDELIGKSFLKLKLLPPKQILKAAKLLLKNEMGKPTGPDELILNRKDGTQVIAEIRAFPVKIKDQTLVLGIARDITARKISESAIIESEKKYRTLFNRIPDPVLIFDKKTHRFLDCNEAVERVYGYTLDELKSMTLFDLNPPDDLDHVKRNIDIKKVDRPFICSHLAKDGRLMTVEIYSDEIDYQGRSAWISIVRDITERKRVEKEVNRQSAHAALINMVGQRVSGELKLEPLLSEIVTAVQDTFHYYGVILLLLDEDTQCLTIQSSSGGFADVSQDEYGIPVGEGMTGYAAKIGQTRVSGNVSKDPHYVCIKSEVTKSELAVPIKSRQKKIIGVLDIQSDEFDAFDAIDIAAMEILSTQIASAIENARLYEQAQREITERKLLESQLVQAQKLESIGQLAAGIAHEINTPTQYVGDNTRFFKESFEDINKVLIEFFGLLASIEHENVTPQQVTELKSLIKELDLAYLQEEIPIAIKQTIEGVDRVAHIVRAMKEFSHPGSKEKTLVDINRAIEVTITVARNEWKYVAELETDFDKGLPPVLCHPDEFNQVILNMITNAAFAISKVVDEGSNGKGNIKISTHHNGDWSEIRIRDTGTGIPEAIRDKIFDPFFTTKEVGKGTGQGLAISRSVVVDKHGGMIDFETEEGKGTTFIIRLPLGAE